MWGGFPNNVGNETWTDLDEYRSAPHHPFQVSNGELTITGGHAAGQDFINVYHFYYDSKKHSMILKKTDQVKPNDLTSSLPTP